jgi:hypothetical protein
LADKVGVSGESFFAFTDWTVIVDLADGVHTTQPGTRVNAVAVSADFSWVLAVTVVVAFGLVHHGGDGFDRAIDQGVSIWIVWAFAMRTVVDHLTIGTNATRSRTYVHATKVDAGQIAGTAVIVLAFRLAAILRQRVSFVKG